MVRAGKLFAIREIRSQSRGDRAERVIKFFEIEVLGRIQMNTQKRTVSVFALILTAGLAWPAAAQTTTPNGSYGVLVNLWPNANQAPSAFLGVLNFDGSGKINGSYTIVTKSTDVLTGTLTGTYSGNADGTNTLNITLDAGATIVAAVAVTDGGTGLQIMVTGGTAIDPGQVLTGTGRLQSAPGTMPAGSYGFVINNWANPRSSGQGVFGILNLDEAGNASGSFAVTGTDVGPTPFTGTFVGSVSINPDGSGSLKGSLVDVGVSLTYAIVVTDGGAGIQFLQTSESDGLGSVHSGIARRQ